ncbi:TRAP transporter small permease subunit [Salinicola sp.]|uniref:TRAP transporter small permease subunit n=1 Tax=Salinicola sp. TaxID=1978524 RepID=UPI0025FC2186|nr:TRAP transporter small permease subunit [Salinicola sp.]
MTTMETDRGSQPFVLGLVRCLRGLDRGMERLGRATAWLTLALVLMVAGDVLFRYVWHVGSVAEQELQWHLLAVIAMISASYTFQQNEHVRVDIFYQHYSPRARQILDIIISLLIVVPSMLFLAWMCLDFVYQSWSLNEGSPDPGGLPARYVIKAFVPLGFALVAWQGIVRGLIDLITLMAGRSSEVRDGT